LNSPLPKRGTSATAVLLNVKGVGGVVTGKSQIKVASTDCPVARPALLPPPCVRSLPLTVMWLLALTLASSLSITQIWPAGVTPRTMLPVTFWSPLICALLVSVLRYHVHSDHCRV
jgi:hypothetical protein